MGQANSSMEQIAGTNNLRIDQVVGSDQLLVKICRNGEEWLSPIGWVSDEKGTLLDCKAEKSSSVVEIPSEFAKKLKIGDKITLTRPDSGFKSEVLWGQTAAVARSRKKANGSTPTSYLSLEDTERRAKEAEKAAASYRAKMEAASHAREAAQAASLEAARKADEALKAEADRIAEMERAAKAFEEAEKLRLDEQRRLDRERRLEEERIAEEARLAEEARVRAAEERLKAERAEARKSIKAEISSAKDEKTRLQDVLANFKSKSEMAESEIADNDKRLARIEQSMASAQKEEADSKAALTKEQNRLGDIEAQSEKVSSAMRSLEKDNEKLFKNLEKVELTHQKALKDVEIAKARAVEAQKALNLVKADSDKVKSQQSNLELDKLNLAKKLSAQKDIITGLRSSYDSSRLTAEKEQSGLRELKKSQEGLQKKISGAKTDISRTLQDIKAADENLSRRKASLKQIEDMENADEIRTLMGKTPQAAIASRKLRGPDKKIPESSEKGGFLGRFFRKAEPHNRSAKPQTKPQLAVKAPAPKSPRMTQTAEPAPTQTLDAKTIKSPSQKEAAGLRLNSWLLIGIAAASIAGLGTAYVMTSQSATAGLVSSADTRRTGQTDPVLMADTSLASDAVNLPQEPETSASTAVSDRLGKDAAIEAENPLEPSPKTEPQKVSTATPVAADSEPAETGRAVRSAPAPKPAPRPTPPRKDYKEVTISVQENLTYLGMYSGEIDGLQTVETQNAMRDFKTLYDLPVNNELSGDFLNSLKRAAEEQRQVREAQTFVPVAEPIEGNVILFATNETTSVWTPAADLNIAANNSISLSPAAIDPVQSILATPSGETLEMPASELPASEVESQAQFAELVLPSENKIADVIPAALPADEIIPASVTRKARAEYPARLLRSNKFLDAIVYVTYDVNSEGRVENASIESIDYDGESRFASYFEKEAIQAVEGQRFDPRLVNGVATRETARVTRISFNGNAE